ncbi:alpha/beta fold hydrolase [Niveispirillum sp. KHB5.9]|uniref:alpha/beta fold hydrolase n=1 Tax=Niveispirillum sp. KHB5.9 TaxID=3400269 RepID=UPI003A8ACD4B
MTVVAFSPDREIPVPPRDADGWERCAQRVAAIEARWAGAYALHHYDFVYHRRLQGHWPARLRRDVAIRCAYTAWGDPSLPLLLCVGGIVNTARRFDYLAHRLSDRFHVVALDWVGRGLSGWMPVQGDYNLATYCAQVLALLRHLGRRRMLLLGSSLGGSVGLALAARDPGLIDRLVLNDVGPYIPAARRARRAQAVARHYLFDSPDALLRRVGAAQKQDGPLSEEERLHNAWHQTCWSQTEGGRIYRHDPRAMQAYADGAGQALDQWAEWGLLTVPTLVLHGMLSDALRPPVLARMGRYPGLCVAHVPQTGHTPALSDPNQIDMIGGFLAGSGPDGPCSIPVTPTALRHG